MSDQQIRDAFEEWCSGRSQNLTRDGRPDFTDGYLNLNTHCLWIGFKAGRASVKESLTTEPSAEPLSTDNVIESVEELIGIGYGSWDTVSQFELVAAFRQVLKNEIPPTQTANPVPVAYGVMYGGEVCSVTTDKEHAIHESNHTFRPSKKGSA